MLLIKEFCYTLLFGWAVFTLAVWFAVLIELKNELGANLIEKVKNSLGLFVLVFILPAYWLLTTIFKSDKMKKC